MAASSKTTGQGNSKNNSLDERDKLFGRIDFKCDKFAEFANDDDDDEKSSEENMCIRGLEWHLKVKKEHNCLGIYAECEKEYKDYYWSFALSNNGWSCRANVSICLHSQKRNGNIVKSSSYNFHPGKCEMGFEYIQIGAILDPKNRWLDKEGALHISADIELLGKPQGVHYIARPHVLLVNGKEVGVNKHHLAANSDYFERFFFGEEYRQNNDVVIDPPATVDHFKRMLDAMEPQNRPLDDKCIEGVLKLANQFFLADVEAKCRHFLSSSHSKHSAIFKYRLADKYGFDMLKEQILSADKKKFTKEDEYFEGLREYAKLDERTRKTLDARLVQLFGNNFFAEEAAEEPPSKRARI